MELKTRETLSRVSYLLVSTLIIIAFVTSTHTTISITDEYYGAPIYSLNEFKVQGKEETWVLTAYCPCSKCSNGHTTASGSYATEGRTLAASSKYPFGTEIYIEGMGLYVVEDRFGGYVNSNRGDIFFESHEEAVNFGRQTRRVIIYGTN